MSQDQRPAKIRLVSGGAPEQPQRRATDPQPELPIAPEAPPKSGSALLLSCLFLAACAAGGALFVLYPPIALAQG